MDLAERRQHRDSAGPRQIVEERFHGSQARARTIGWQSSGTIEPAGGSCPGGEPEREARRRGQPQAVSERLERRCRGRNALARLVLAQAPLRDARDGSDLGLGDAVRAQNRDRCAEIAALARVEHVLARKNALYYFPDNRDVHCHGARPVPLVARLLWVVTFSHSYERTR
jgi:hypothetical protein